MVLWVEMYLYRFRIDSLRAELTLSSSMFELEIGEESLSYGENGVVMVSFWGGENNPGCWTVWAYIMDRALFGVRRSLLHYDDDWMCMYLICMVCCALVERGMSLE